MDWLSEFKRSGSYRVKKIGVSAFSEEFIHQRGNDMRVGDRVHIVDVNHGTRTATVTQVGRRYFTADRHEFEIETGRARSREYGGHMTALTEEEYERRQSYERLKLEAIDFAETVRLSRVRELETQDSQHLTEGLKALRDYLDRVLD